MLWDRVNDHNDIRSNNTEQYHHQQQQHLTDIHTNSYSYSDSTSDDEDEEEDARSSSICEDLDYHGSNSSITSFIGNYNSRIKGPGYRLRADIDNEDDDAVSSSSSLSSDNESSSSEDIHPLRHGIRPNTAATSTRSTSLNADKRLLISSRDTRQFEFHPTYDNIILTGHRSGHISIINSDIDECISSIKVDDSPILGLAWLNHTPNTAIYGASPSGNVGYIKYDKSLITAQRTSTFKHLSSISINSTDDYFMTSGFVPTVALFDLTTDDRIIQFDLRFHNNNNTQSSSSLPLLRVDIKALHSRTNYRRSVYLADGCNFVTAGTDENYYRIMSVDDGSDKATYNNPSPAAAAGGGGGGGIASLDDDLNDRSDAGSIMEDTVVDETAEEEEEEEDQPATTTTVGHPDGESDDNGGDGLAMCLKDHEYDPDDSETLLEAFHVLDPERKGWVDCNEMRDYLGSGHTGFREKEMSEFIEFARDREEDDQNVK
ncbi:hypothetical protein FOL47_009638 [Perkinsus chesapeaki]|uniref:EF-hand domain-containing protein n=1 Tax=Perkinsus chesapeaki TaxID=330153 RepID=A0A7J6L742_PERCH|nr:hypothetical protein FOL47_009638 [Perkinsus chesapeaki]